MHDDDEKNYLKQPIKIMWKFEKVLNSVKIAFKIEQYSTTTKNLDETK